MSVKHSWELNVYVDEINDVAEMIHQEIYGTWKYQDLEKAALYGSRTVSPKCIWAVCRLVPTLSKVCSLLNNYPKLLTVNGNILTHLKKLFDQNLKAYEFYDVNSLYMDLAQFSLAILEAQNEIDEINERPAYR